MAMPLTVFVIAPSTVVARGVEQMLNGDPAALRTEIAIGAELARDSASPPDAVIIAPQHWEELAA